MKQIFKSIGIATIVAAAAVPSALAMHPGDGYAGAVTPNTLSVKADTSDVFTRYVANHAAGGYDGYKSSYPQLHQVAPNGISVKADTSRAAGYDGYKSSYPQLHQVGQSGPTVPYLSHGIGVDASQFGGTGVTQVSTRPDDKAGVRTSQPTSIVALASSGNGFNWDDAGIGAGGALGLVLLMGLGAAVTQRNRKGPLTA